MDSNITNTVDLIENAKKFLIENSTKNKIIATRIFNVNVRSLQFSIRCDSGEKKGDQNQILNKHEIKTIHQRIKSLLTHEILFTHALVFNYIVNLKRAQNLAFVDPSQRWFKNW